MSAVYLLDGRGGFRNAGRLRMRLFFDGKDVAADLLYGRRRFFHICRKRIADFRHRIRFVFEEFYHAAHVFYGGIKVRHQ